MARYRFRTADDAMLIVSIKIAQDRSIPTEPNLMLGITFRISFNGGSVSAKVNFVTAWMSGLKRSP